jgi:hypothetical protein
MLWGDVNDFDTEYPLESNEHYHPGKVLFTSDVCSHGNFAHDVWDNGYSSVQELDDSNGGETKKEAGNTDNPVSSQEILSRIRALVDAMNASFMLLPQASLHVGDERSQPLSRPSAVEDFTLWIEE